MGECKGGIVREGYFGEGGELDFVIAVKRSLFFAIVMSKLG